MLSKITKTVNAIAEDIFNLHADIGSKSTWTHDTLHEEYYKRTKKAIEAAGGKEVIFVNCDYYGNLEYKIIDIINSNVNPVYAIHDPYHDHAGTTLHGYIIFTHNKKEKHQVSFEGGLDQLAEDIGNLRYDALNNFLVALSKKLEKDAKSDNEKQRHKLSKQLNYSAKHIKNAWNISKNFMKPI